MNYQVDKRTKGFLVGRGPLAIGRLLLTMHRLEVSARYRLPLFCHSLRSPLRGLYSAMVLEVKHGWVLKNCKYTGQIDFQALSTCVKHLFKVYFYKCK